MISLDLFKSIISHIKQQEEKDEKLTKLLIDSDFTGWISTANGLIDDLVKLLEYELGDKYEYISWWLYDISDGNKFVYEDFKDDKQVRYNLNDLKDLYNYIIGDLEAVKQDIVNKNKEDNTFKTVDDSVFNEFFDTIWSETDEL
jgi:hypothetical protein